MRRGVAIALLLVALAAVAPRGAEADVGDVEEFPLPASVGGLTDITTGPDGNLWIVAVAGIGNHVGRLTPTGEYTEFEIASTANSDASIVAGPDGALWFTEWNGNESAIGRITVDGDYTRFELDGGAQPQDIAVGPDGNLWFPEAGTRRIGRISVDGDLSEFEIPDTDGDLEAIAATDAGLWFTETRPNRVRFITVDGDLGESIDTDFEAIELSLAPDGRLWIAGGSYSQIGRLESDGTLTRFTMPTFAQDLVVDSQGFVWLTTSNLAGEGFLVIRLDPDTGEQINVDARRNFGAGSVLTLGPDDQVWVIESQFAESPGANGKVVARVLTGAPIRGTVAADEQVNVFLFVPDLSDALTPENVARSAWISLVVVILVLFPTQLFNATVDANYERLPRRLRGNRSVGAPVWRQPWAIALFVAAAAVIYVAHGLLNELRFDSPAGLGDVLLDSAVGFGVGLLVATALGAGLSRFYLARRGEHGELEAKPVTLPVAVGCVAASVAVGFSPASSTA